MSCFQYFSIKYVSKSINKKKPENVYNQTYIWSENLNPARFLLSSGVLEAESHTFFVSVPALHLCPLKSYYLVLRKRQNDTNEKQNIYLNAFIQYLRICLCTWKTPVPLPY